MALKKLTAYTGTVNGEERTATVYRDAEWNEYRVKFHRDGVYQVDADYHDDDKQSAMDTAQHYCTPARID